MFPGQSAPHLILLDVWVLIIMTGRSVKGAEPCNQLVIGKPGITITDMANLNILD